MSEMFLVVAVIIVSLLVALGTVSVMAKFVRRREAISAVREELKVSGDGEHRLAA